MDRDFKGVWIPKEIWLDTRLNALDKVILTEIDSLDDGENGCYASNQYLSEFCQCSATKVSTAISKLQEYGYIEQVDFDGRHRKIKSCLTKIERQPYEICKADIQNLKANNIDNNKDNKNLIIRGNNGKCICQNCKMEVSDLQNGIVESDKPIPYTITDTETDTENIYSQIVKAYNEICISLPKCIKLTDKRKKKMEARLKDNSYEDIITAFTKAEQSDFLSGRNGKWQACNFEWFFDKPDTILNVLEGKYDQKKAYNSVELKFEKALDNIRSGVHDNGSYFD